MVHRAKSATCRAEIALVGKYTELHDSYLSVVEALSHAGTENDAIVEIRWIDSETITEANVGEQLAGVDGVLVPGGFGSRGIEGMISSARYARENRIPFLGICYGMHMAVIEFARHVANMENANSSEINELTKYPVIDLMPDQVGITKKGGTMRLGKYPCILKEGSRVRELYGRDEISERHRHRYEFNNDYRETFEKLGMSLSGLSPSGALVEIIELGDHPWYVGVQFHPELKSRPNRAHPLFFGLIEAALTKQLTINN
jgi:CTP synthase